MTSSLPLAIISVNDHFSSEDFTLVTFRTQLEVQFGSSLVEFLPSGGDDWGCWPPGRTSLGPSAEREREREAQGSVNTTGHMIWGLKLLSEGLKTTERLLETSCNH